ncbi:cobyrinate a,c-diamide synthase [uncultured Jatrophihabitans sp.]|uniref:cobyrinate a,c-diamide synthase n=1 Tax=uncultured Jatrophihabitans sp. TaxID=1610747 RepID=UPI0035CB26D5
MPRIVIAAPASGSGKTMITTGLLAALRRTGLRVSGHKVGPDYIDPGYHALASGRVGRNLDPWLVGEDRVAPLLLHGAQHLEPADIAVVEGVMGLHDGVVGSDAGFASTAHVARLIGAPVVLVLDTTAQGRTAAAVVHGLQLFDPRVRVGGVILNRVGSPRHESLLRAAMAEVGVPVLGSVARSAEAVTPSRHLGLIPAAERRADAEQAVAALADLVADGVDLAAVMELARTAPPLDVKAWNPAHEVARVGDGVRVALAGGAAFSFGYAETAELLTAAGADVVTVDPLRDTALPAGAAGLVLGGGFPEAHAEQLAANTGLRADVAAFDGPIAAECAGLLYLCRSLDGAPMAGVLDAAAAMTPRLTLGYREAVADVDSPVAAAGERVRGHDFHRTATDPAHGESAAWRYAGAGRGNRHGFASRRVHAAYLHTHWAGRPSAAERFAAACRG